MFLFRFFALIGFGILSLEGFCQSDTLNREDENGRQGYWIIYGYMKPDKGYCDSCRIEEGPYIDGRKNGLWTKYYKNVPQPRLKGVYKDNRPNGTFKKYDENGEVIEEGVFNPGEQVRYTFKRGESGGVRFQKSNKATQYISVFQTESDTIYKLDGTVNEVINHGFKDTSNYDRAIYFFSNGLPEFVYYKKDEVTIGPALRFYSTGELREYILYDSEGIILSRKKYEEADRGDYSLQGEQGCAFNPSLGHQVQGNQFKTNGDNKVYNEAGKILLDGKFRNGILWNGESYVYTPNGTLLRVKVWEKGQYVCDRAL